MTFENAYEDEERVEAYSMLEFPGTYYLAYRDLPRIIGDHVTGRSAFDFGCGAGRSTRFLRKIGFDAIGVDISEQMIKKALEIEPKGNYHLISDGEFSRFESNHYDLVLSAFTFDNIPNVEKRAGILTGLKRLLKKEGKMVLVCSSPEIYTNEWASLSTKDFPENQHAGSGDRVRIIITDIKDKRPVEDLIWFDNDYRQLFDKAGLSVVEVYKPLAKQDEPFEWVNETRIAPWVIYVLKKADGN